MQKVLFENNPILKLTFEFSLSIIAYCEALQAEKRYVVGNQLLRSATSIGANTMEAQNAESKADFIHKMKIAAKEADETLYWLLLCEHSAGYPDTSELSGKLDSISKMLNRILTTSKKKEFLQD